uniref:Uncharacterized protein n=1 Tax=viral metagenome TaxID=1070528 RepID=A0A6C0J3T0_9ZZZZ
MKTIILIIIIALLLFSKKIVKKPSVATFVNKDNNDFKYYQKLDHLITIDETNNDIKYYQNSDHLITSPTIDETNNDNFIKDIHHEMLGRVNEEISEERLNEMQGYEPELEDNVDFKYREPEFMRMAQPYFTI